MRILHCITRFNQGGTVTWLNQLVNNDEHHGHELFLLFGDCPPHEIEGTPNEKFQTIRSHFLARSINPIKDLCSIFEIRRILNSLRPDILATHTFKAGLVARLAASTIKKSRRPKVVHTIHGHLQYGYFGKFGASLITKIEIFLERFTDVFIVAGNKLLDEVMAKGQLISSDFKVIRPGIDVSRFLPRATVSTSEKIQVGWLGRLTEIKRPDRVLEIAKRLGNVDFTIAGAGELESELRRESPANLTFVGWVAPEGFWLNKDIGLLTSDNEATPYSIIEGSLCCVPFVATNVGSVTDALIDSETGLLAESSIDSLIEKIQLLVRDSDYRKSLGNKAREYSLENFSAEKFQNEHLTVYEQILALD